MARKPTETTTTTKAATRKRPQPDRAERPSGPATLLAQSLPAVMPAIEEQPTAAPPVEDTVPRAGVGQPPSGDATDRPSPAGDDGQPERQWAPPYRAAFTSAAGGLEVGEDRRFKQVVVRFADRPGSEVTDRLKEAGFKYRAAERSWTAPASAAAREFANGLAQELHLLAGGNTSVDRGR